MSSPPYRGQISSYIFETHNVTSTCKKTLVWQTRQQRTKHDMANKVSHYEDNTGRWEREEERRKKTNDDVRISRYDGNGYSKYNDLREKLDSKKREKGYDDNWKSTRSRSYTRVKSGPSRGRNRSPRSPGVLGPSILKTRSQSAHGGRWGGDTIVSEKTFKMFRISNVVQVHEYSPSSDDVDDVTEQESEEFVSKSDKDVKGRTPNKMTSCTKKSPSSREKFSSKLKDGVSRKNLRTKDCRSIKKAKAPVGKGSLNSETGADNMSEDDNLHLQSDPVVPSVDIIGLTEVEISGNTLPNAEDSRVEETPNHEHTRADGTTAEDVNQNDIFGDEGFHGFTSQDINENFLSGEEDLHGYDVTDLDIIDDNNVPVEHLINAHDEKRVSDLTIVCSGDYQTRQVPCQHKDCPRKSTPSTIGLLPFSSKPGHEWLCPDHIKCLLCPEPVDNTNSAMCVVCARVFHISHLQELGIEVEDMEEMICKLCSDPEQFTPARKQSSQGNGVRQSGIDNIAKLNHTITTSGNRREIMTTDHSLPSGWSRQIVINSENRKRVVIIGPNARKYWSKRDLEKAFKDKDEGVEWKSFSFSLYTAIKK